MLKFRAISDDFLRLGMCDYGDSVIIQQNKRNIDHENNYWLLLHSRPASSHCVQFISK